MGQATIMRIAVTGAAGFIGRAVIRLIDRGVLGSSIELRLNDLEAIRHPSATIIEGSYARQEVRDRLVGDGIDMLFHLASLPGGAAEHDPLLGKMVNLDGSIALIDAVAGLHCPVLVYASSIAALGHVHDPVTDATALRPAGSYGTHKAMIEYYLADLTRRGLIDGRALRPSGIIARPRNAYRGFATAWMSDLFHAAVEQRPIVIPARPDAHIWLQSIEAVAHNIVHAAGLSSERLASHRVWTLPASVVRLDALVGSLKRHLGHDLSVTYGDGPIDQPPLAASDALALGFCSDGDVDGLVKAVIAQIRPS